VVLLAASGCGEEAPKGKDRGDRKGGAKGAKKQGRPVSAPEPREGVDEAARALASAIRTGDCERFKALSFSGLKRLAAEDCNRQLDRLKGFELQDMAQYGTGAVVDFTTDRAPGTMLFVLAKDGTFGWAQRLLRKADEKVAATRAPASDELDQIAEQTVEALRTGDCARLAEQARGVLDKPKVPGRTCESRAPLRKRLEKDRDVKPQRLGANAKVAFYSLLPKPGGPYDTLVFIRKGEEAAFLRDFPIPAKGK
jgi:hypothetical protein